MKEELILLAKKKEFESKMVSSFPWKYSTKEELRWSNWMNELQKWLREVHNIHISMLHFWDFDNDTETYQANISQLNNEVLHSDYHDIYELSLEEGLKESLKLI